MGKQSKASSSSSGANRAAAASDRPIAASSSSAGPNTRSRASRAAIQSTSSASSSSAVRSENVTINKHKSRSKSPSKSSRRSRSQDSRSSTGSAKGVGPLMARMVLLTTLAVIGWQFVDQRLGGSNSLMQGTQLLTRPRRDLGATLRPTDPNMADSESYKSALMAAISAHASSDAETAHAAHLHDSHEARARRAAINPGVDVYTTQNVATWYRCDASACRLPNCQCAQQRPPAGLDKSVVPQFVIVTVDDALNEMVLDAPLQLYDGVVNPGTGCQPKITYFMSGQWSNFHLAQRMFAKGHEIAGHTWGHSANPNVDDISAMRQATEALAGISASDIKGFRAPLFKFSLDTLATLRSLGFEYDSSMTALVNGNNTVWPFTFDYGMPISCATGNCTGATPPIVGLPRWKVPGLWEIPLYTLTDPEAPDGNWPIDPPMQGDKLNTLLRVNFDNHFYGNRAPFGIHIHAAWLMAEPSRITTINAFLRDIAQHQHVRFVTNQEMLAWLKNPQPITSMPTPATSTNFACPGAESGSVRAEVCDGIDNNRDGQVDEGLTKSCNYGSAVFTTCAASCPVRYPTVAEPVPPPSNRNTLGTLCQPPVGGCVYGTYNRTECACACFGPGTNGAGGCPRDEATGKCLVYRLPSTEKDAGYLSCDESREVMEEERRKKEEEIRKQNEATRNGGTTNANKFTANTGTNGDGEGNAAGRGVEIGAAKWVAGLSVAIAVVIGVMGIM
ncbi:hypothetical protein BCR44DRAFT_36839 [Catenaria anguillulae PL171]|uniref:NodB homology domain-containing protein n=1 Tax=Catenaria anguillulae PL171 TaxID=765915 RepID=A0A1Y2H9Y0_9FUNG|nr:hypothetical protein BCR44DRAFT_36839 [Catenaria anguillulae PL171]